MQSRATIALVAAAAGLIGGCGSNGGDTSSRATVGENVTTEVRSGDEIARDPDVPELPFPDNPDPDACGIPRPWGDDGTAWLSGVWDGELIEPQVLLYESHLRYTITGRAPHGSEVRIVLYQENPTLDYYFVEVVDDPTQQGWVPAPFLSFDPVA
jgi:hypothetical protein